MWDIYLKLFYVLGLLVNDFEKIVFIYFENRKILLKQLSNEAFLLELNYDKELYKNNNK